MKRIVLLFVALCTIFVAKAQEDAISELRHITKEQFLDKVYDYEKHPKKWIFKGDKPCIFIFHATWCPPCRETMPIMELINLDYGDMVDIYQINVDMQPELSLHFQLEHIPTIYFCKKDNSEPKHIVKVPTYEEIGNIIEHELLKIR